MADGREVLLADTDLFFFFLTGGRLEEQAARVVGDASDGRLELRTSSEVYDDAITVIRSDGHPLSLARDFVADMRSIPHTPLPIDAQVAEEAVSMYLVHGGRRKLSYFDSFHVATAKRYGLKLLTSDRFIIKYASTLGIGVADLSGRK